jgi:hypothetical protein
VTSTARSALPFPLRLLAGLFGVLRQSVDAAVVAFDGRHVLLRPRTQGVKRAVQGETQFGELVVHTGRHRRFDPAGDQAVTGKTLEGGGEHFLRDSRYTAPQFREAHLARGRFGQHLHRHRGPFGADTVEQLPGRAQRAEQTLTGSDDNTVRVWDLQTGCQIGEPLTGHTGGLRAVACFDLNDRPVAVTGSVDTTVRVWDLETGCQIGEPLTSHTEVYAVACTKLGGRLVVLTGSAHDDGVRVWDLETGQQIGEPLTGHTGSCVYAVACIDLNGRPVAVTGSDDNTVRVWDLQTGCQIGEPLTGHASTVYAVACIDLNGRPVAITGAVDQALRVWDLQTGCQIGEPHRPHRNRTSGCGCPS